jgi:hypothetical protein
MRAYTIKHKGKTIWQNMVFEKEIEFSDNEKVLVGFIFFRKKDAVKYLKTFYYPEFHEVVGVTIDKCEKDNRKRSS